MSRHLSFIVVVLMFAAVAPVRASGPLVTGGEPVAEPLPGRAKVHVVREDLRIDMRPVRDKQPVQVVARYLVRNDGPRQPLSLFFVAPGLAHGEVRHQGRIIPARARAGSSARGNRKPGQTSSSFSSQASKVIDVEYQAEPEALHHNLVDSYTIDYGLEPARHWASFGVLSLDVQVPEDFEVLEAPEALASSESGLRAEFRALPNALVKHHRVAAALESVDLQAGAFRLQIAPARAPYCGSLTPRRDTSTCSRP